MSDYAGFKKLKLKCFVPDPDERIPSEYDQEERALDYVKDQEIKFYDKNSGFSTVFPLFDAVEPNIVKGDGQSDRTDNCIQLVSWQWRGYYRWNPPTASGASTGVVPLYLWVFLFDRYRTGVNNVPTLTGSPLGLFSGTTPVNYGSVLLNPKTERYYTCIYHKCIELSQQTGDGKVGPAPDFNFNPGQCSVQFDTGEIPMSLPIRWSGDQAGQFPRFVFVAGQANNLSGTVSFPHQYRFKYIDPV